MCGIAGLVRFAGLRPHETSAGLDMAAFLRHRGPDEMGTYVDGHASLGHARLSIIDLADGRQPMSNEDGTIQVVFNGEIYNHLELAEQLRARGHVLRTRCDTEVLAHLYEDHGDSFPEYLNGMFAIAIWDSRSRRLVLVRDRLGVKPLFWTDDGRRVAFGSELKAVLACGDLERRINPLALADYLTFGHVPAPKTIFSGVRKLEPGCMAVCTGSGTSVHRWWDIPFGDADSAKPDERAGRRWTEDFASLLENAVDMRLMSDVPLGAFLSGGVDSSAVVAAMCRCSQDPVLTHTVGFDEPCCDEREAARVVAHRLDTDHREVLVRSDAAAAIERLTRHFDEPFADSCAVPLLRLSEITRQRVTVALSGDGGDEMLAGYRRYRFDLAEATIREMWPGWLRRSTAGAMGRIYPKADWLPRSLRAKATLCNLACDDITAHLRSTSLAAGMLPDLLLRPEMRCRVVGYDPFARGRDLFARCPSSLLNRLLYVDMKTLMVDDILTKVDRASMAVGLEVRTPLLDYRIVELSARMPAWLKLDGRRDKVVLRDTVRRWLGPDVAGRRKKGFDVPVNEWFRGPLRPMASDLLMSPEAVCSQWIDQVAVRALFARHQSGISANGHILWALLSLELWARQYARGPGPVREGQDGRILRRGTGVRSPEAAVCGGMPA
ncbi:MAG TPA: asparagine synthase (glutamine-hydrolyzing) [Phycisphaerae bacterium]|nr:asparagine synthase (glutamine-hydrolyzing) [Phycisphaerae bacterium]HRR85201.1 asparagine synthase (glutamine-hydrolyzing) [Phycisphaerae bacterium]